MGSDIWLTPPWVLDALGEFDLDPCASVGQPWRTAETQYTKDEDGLSQEWFGRVWLNPPYGLQASQWLSRLVVHGTGTALLFARTETRMFFDHVWPHASGVLFIEGRLFFHQPDGTRAGANAGAPSVLVAYGERDAALLLNASYDAIPGKWVDLR